MKKIALLPLVLFLALSGFAAAKYITIATSVEECFTETGQCAMNITVANYGDEPASQTRISVVSDIVSGDEISQKILYPNERIYGLINVDPKAEMIPGKYPVFVMVEYEDANSYPFTAISPAFFVYKTQTSSKVKGVASEITISEKESGKISVRLMNYDDAPHNVSIGLMLSRELKFERGKKTVVMEANGDGTVEFDVAHFSALAGSAYPAFVSIEYDSGGLHYVYFVRGLVKISKSEGIFSNQAIGVIIALLAAAVAYNLYFKRGKSA
ncbi:MAG: hypothetical protein V1731_03045 [Candidatus Aenigmatarchaeota archaeon]